MLAGPDREIQQYSELGPGSTIQDRLVSCVILIGRVVPQISYWSKRVMSPSSLLFYIGLNRTVSDRNNHTNTLKSPYHALHYRIYA